ncbi:MAG: DUF6602 domain-containing protein [Nitrosopumilaceae archaeon]
MQVEKNKLKFSEMLSHFQAESNKLEDQRQSSAIFKLGSDSGTLRESSFLDFLIRYLPKSCNVISGGFIFDSKENHSKQIDIIVTSDLSLQFLYANREKKAFSSKNQLWRKLPKQVQYPTFKKILDYLESSNKIMYDKDGAIVWIFADNSKLRKLLRESTRLR